MPPPVGHMPCTCTGTLDTTGEVCGVETIATGLRWKRLWEPLRSSARWRPLHARPAGSWGRRSPRVSRPGDRSLVFFRAAAATSRGRSSWRFLRACATAARSRRAEAEAKRNCSSVITGDRRPADAGWSGSLQDAWPRRSDR